MTSFIVTATPQTIIKSRIIDVTDSIPDITANIIHDSEHYQLPSDIFEDLVFQALNDLIDDFALNPDKYLKPHHYQKLDHLAHHYLHS